MSYRKRSRDEHLASDGSPKRILALDGGGLRGILSVGYLAELERILRERHGGGDDFRLSHYFDLVAGTSTGAIIAAAVALGWTAEELRSRYFDLGAKVFERSLFRQGFLRAKYDSDRLIQELKEAMGADTTVGSDALETGLLVVTKRMDTGSPWPISNNPAGKYFGSEDGETIGNGDYRLWQTVRASTAAPSFFEPETIRIAELDGHPTQEGQFVDGGVSPFNNPALQALMYATLEGYRVGWPTGADRLLIVSVGTGMADAAVRGSRVAAVDAVKSLLALMDDSAALQETLLQWISSSPTARPIDGELGTLEHDLLGPEPLISYLRYNTGLDADTVRALRPGVLDEQLSDLGEMDAPENMQLLWELGVAAAAEQMRPQDLPTVFDLQ
jgi:predicted acylesterase/phospholipase RssA